MTNCSDLFRCSKLDSILLYKIKMISENIFNSLFCFVFVHIKLMIKLIESFEESRSSTFE